MECAHKFLAISVTVQIVLLVHLVWLVPKVLFLTCIITLKFVSILQIFRIALFLIAYNVYLIQWVINAKLALNLILFIMDNASANFKIAFTVITTKICAINARFL
jgi:hypothetical protein